MSMKRVQQYLAIDGKAVPGSYSIDIPMQFPRTKTSSMLTVSRRSCYRS